MIDGLAKYIFYNDDTSIRSEVLLSPYDNLGSFYCFISSGVFHRFIPYSLIALHMKSVFHHLDLNLHLYI